MAIEKTTNLATVEIIFSDRAVNAAWHTYITEDGEVISGPSIHRRAFSADELADVQPAIDVLLAKFQESP